MTSEEEYLLLKIEEFSKKKMEYLEVDNNRQAKVWEQKEDLYSSIFRLVQDGLKLRRIEAKANETLGEKYGFNARTTSQD